LNSYTDLKNPAGSANTTAQIISPKLNLFFQANAATQFYLMLGKGFHSNDTRAVVAKNGLNVLPPAYGLDLGTVIKPYPNLLVNAALWYLFVEQEFVYVGDEGIVEPSGRSRRIGMDLSFRWEPLKWLELTSDLNLAKPRFIDEPKDAQNVPLAPTFTSSGGINVQLPQNIQFSIRSRFMGNRAANESRSIIAQGYQVHDLYINKQWKNLELSGTIQNLLNTHWKETQFNTESRLKNELEPVSEIHFTPGTPRFFKISIRYKF
jgi:outer membrane receptor protein involved in Fe transport